MRERDKEPDGAGDAEEDGGEEEAVVVTKPGDRGRGGESTSGTSDFVKDMLVEMWWSDELQEMTER